uniref:Uncharacterized protein n=1 Tax=Noctiluca scintillans TaxID=2966 RepID=A0A7S1ANC3_NOCSC|mmetsp:Transcript_53058/g.141847  ORF Transcript_53058/g.141847 Transcript_53058/m.141847 type:complete len:108 (+) Transcript_53058:39-362(+)
MGCSGGKSSSVAATTQKPEEQAEPEKVTPEAAPVETIVGEVPQGGHQEQPSTASPVTPAAEPPSVGHITVSGENSPPRSPRQQSPGGFFARCCAAPSADDTSEVTPQ